MSSHVEKIKERLGVVDVIGSYIPLEKAGGNFKAKCPFHNEKSPSFFISPARNTYYCFGCGAKGDIFSFVQEFEGLDFMGALRVLAKRAGVELVRENPELRTERERLYLTLEHATLFYQKQLIQNKEAVEYLKNRGLTAKTISDWRIGYAPLSWNALTTNLKPKGIKNDDLEKVGLIKKSEKNQKEHYDRFRGRIMFPIFDSSGRTVAFSGRQFEKDGTEAKYINSPETALFEKSRILYGFDRAKLAIRKEDCSILVEGQMDLIMSHQAGFAQAVASSGTALTLEQLEMLKRLSKNITIAYDGDDAGANAAARGWQLALGLGMEVKIATFPKGQDPADVIKADQKVFEDAVKNARHIIEVELDRIISKESDPRKRGKFVEQQLLPYVATIESAIESTHFISLISSKAGIKEEGIREEVRKLRQKSLVQESRPEPQKAEVALRSRKHTMERLLVGIIFWQEKLEKPQIDVLDISQKLGNIIGTQNIEELRSAAAPTRDELTFEAEVTYAGSTNLAGYVEDILHSLKEEKIREELQQAMVALAAAEREKNNEHIATLLKRCQDLSTELSALSRAKK